MRCGPAPSRTRWISALAHGAAVVVSVLLVVLLLLVVLDLVLL
jgi:hypothetical protein